MPVNNRFYLYDPNGTAHHIAHRLHSEGLSVVIYSDLNVFDLSGIVEYSRRGPRRGDIVLFNSDDEGDYVLELKADGFDVLGGASCLNGDEEFEKLIDELELNYAEEAPDFYYATVGWFDFDKWVTPLTTAVCASRLLAGGYGPQVHPMWTLGTQLLVVPTVIEHFFHSMVEILNKEDYSGPVTICWHMNDDNIIYVEDIKSNWQHDSLLGAIISQGYELGMLLQYILKEMPLTALVESQYVATARIGIPPFPFSGTPQSISFSILMEDRSNYWLSGVRSNGRELMSVASENGIGIATAVGEKYFVIEELKNRIDRLLLPDKMWRNDIRGDQLERLEYYSSPLIQPVSQVVDLP